LGVPDHADPLVALGRGSPDGLLYGEADGVELVVARQFLADDPRILLEDDEVADQIEEATLLEHAPDQRLQLRHRLRGDILALDRPPRREPLPVCRQRADLRLVPVGEGSTTRTGGPE
jgi:hypothetical protein